VSSSTVAKIELQITYGIGLEKAGAKKFKTEKKQSLSVRDKRAVIEITSYEVN